MGDPFTVGEHTYRIEQMPAMDQFHILRRLAPLIGSFKNIASGSQAAFEEMAELLMPVAGGVSKMTNEETEYIIYTCLKYVRRQTGQSWVVVYNEAAKTLQFQDINMLVMLNLTFQVIVEQLGSFSPELLLGSKEENRVQSSIQ